MERGRQRLIAAGLFLLVAAVLVLTMRHSTRRTAYITLPEPGGLAGMIPGDFEQDNRYTPVEITPRTVQTAIATLRRLDSYRRTVTITQFWPGGSGTCTAETTVYLPWSRIDLRLPDQPVRHTITNGQWTYLWYENDETALFLPAGSITADDEQHIPTYEDVLNLPTEQIALADYRTLSGVNCIYVETAEEGGASERYWIGVDNGLLAAAERLENGETVYRMEALNLDAWDPDPAPFTLPDGTVVTPVP